MQTELALAEVDRSAMTFALSSQVHRAIRQEHVHDCTASMTGISAQDCLFIIVGIPNKPESTIIADYRYNLWQYFNQRTTQGQQVPGKCPYRW